MSYSAGDFLNDMDSLAAQYRAPVLNFAAWLEMAREDLTDEPERPGDLRRRFLAERIGTALWERVQLIRQRDALAAALSELVAEHDARNAERDPARDGLIRDTGGIALARTALAIKNPEAQP